MNYIPKVSNNKKHVKFETVFYFSAIKQSGNALTRILDAAERFLKNKISRWIIENLNFCAARNFVFKIKW